MLADLRQLFQNAIFQNAVFQSDSDRPYGSCYPWSQALAGLHIGSDILIAIAYFAVLLGLIYFARQRQDFPYPKILWSLSIFVAACGTTHLTAVWTLWHPNDWIFGIIKAITAFLSVYTAIALIPFIPLAIALPSPAQLTAATASLKQEIAERQRSEEKFRAMFEQVAVGMNYVDMNGRFILVNQKFCDITGYGSDELCSKTFDNITHPEDRVVEDELTRQLIEGERSTYGMEKRYIRRDGHQIWVHLTASIVRDAAGVPKYMLGTAEDISDRKQAEAALQASQERFRRAIVNAPLPVLIHAEDGEILQVNQTWTELTGYTSDDIPTMAEWTERAYGQRVERVRSHIDQLYALDHKVDEGEFVLQTATGEKRAWTFSSAPLGTLADGRRTVISMALDITQRRQAEHLLTQQKGILEMLATGVTLPELLNRICNMIEDSSEDLLQAAILLTNADATLLNKGAAPSFPETYAKAVDQVQVGLDFGPCAAAAALKQSVMVIDIAQGIVQLEQADLTWQPADAFRHLALQHNFQACWSTPILGSEGQLLGTFALYAFVPRRPRPTEIELINVATHLASIAIGQRQADEKIRQMNKDLELRVAQRTAELKTCFDTLPDYIYMIEREEMRLSFCNDLLAQSAGFSNRDELIGKTIFESFPAENAAYFAAQNQEVFSSGQTLHIQESFDLPTGKLCLDTFKIPLKTPDGQVYALIGSSRDITELVEARQVLAERTAQLEIINQELDSFSYSVSHDLRAPLRHIQGFVSALRQRLEQIQKIDDPKIVHYIDVIQASGHKMGLLIDGLLTLSRMGRRPMNRQPVDLNPLVQAAIALLPEITNTAAPIQFVVNKLPTVQGDATLLQQVFSNLISNAAKFSGVSALVAKQRGYAPRVEVGVTAAGAIFVKDNGVGFQMAYADQLFGAFQRLHAQHEFEGTGIGLAIVQRIIHRHGGKIWAESEPNQGACFYFTLIEPLAAQTERIFDSSDDA